MPVSIVQGDEDFQVRVADAQTLAAASAQATLTVIAGMNHVLKARGGDRAAQAASYASPNLPLHPELMATLCPGDAVVHKDIASQPASVNPAVTGTWAGKAVRLGLRIVFHIEDGEYGLTGTFDSPDQGAFGAQLSRVSVEGDQVTLASSVAGFLYTGRLEKKKKRRKIVGELAQAGRTLPTTLRKK